jgi:hypothetical protein
MSPEGFWAPTGAYHGFLHLGDPSGPPKTPQNELGPLKVINWHQSTHHSVSFAPKMTKIFNKVQEISNFERTGHVLFMQQHTFKSFSKITTYANISGK